MLPEHTCYSEPFAGAAWVLFRKPESKVEVIKDINHEIVTFFLIIQHHLEELAATSNGSWWPVTNLRD